MMNAEHPNPTSNQTPTRASGAHEDLSGVPVTLLITVWGRARDSLGSNPLIDDPFAVELYRAHPEWFGGLDGMGSWMKKTGTLGIAIRTRCFDQQVSHFLEAHPDGLILNIGCGLDARSHRLDNGVATWVDVDLPQSQAWRRRLLPNSDRHHVIEGSVLEPDAWLPQLPRRAEQPVFVVSEGTLMYFEEDVARRLVSALIAHLGAFQGYLEMIGDLSKDKVHPMVRAVGSDAPFRLGSRDPKNTFTGFHPSIRVTKKEGLFHHERRRWGIFRWATALVPSLHDRLGSVMLAFEVADQDANATKNKKYSRAATPDGAHDIASSAQIPFVGVWSRRFSPAPDQPHTATYTVTNDSIRYQLTGDVGSADYIIARDAFSLRDGRFVGHTDEGQHHVIFVKDASDEEVTLYKQTVASLEEGLQLAIPASDDTDNHGWNTYYRGSQILHMV